MAIVSVKRIDIIGHSSLKSPVLNYLQETGSVQIIRDREEEMPLEYGEDSLESMISTEMQNVKYIEDAVSLLDEYAPGKSLLETIRNESESVRREVFESISDDEHTRLVIEKALNLKGRLAEAREELRKQENAVSELMPWKSLNVRLSALSSLKSSRMLTGKVDTDELAGFTEGLSSAASLSGCETVSEQDGDTYVTVVYHRDAELEVLSYLSDSPFEEIKLPSEDITVANLIAQSEKRITALKNEIADTGKKLKEISGDISKIKARFDSENQRYERLIARRYLGNTESTFKIRGWVPVDSAASVAEDIEKLGPAKVDIFDPGKEDGAPPVILRNRKAFKSFELVTQLYGLPSYGGVDPTAFLAPFFFLFFGLCLSDAGYGIMLSAAMAVFMWVVGIKGKVYSLFFWGGIATIIGGAVTGSWFGVNVLELPPDHWAGFLRKFVMFDPLGTKAEPFAGLKLEGTMAFFYLSIFLGFIQICFGTVLAAVYKIMNKKPVSGLLDDGSWLMVYIGLGMFVVSLKDVVGLRSYGKEFLTTPGLALLFTGLGLRLVVFPIMHVLFESEKKSTGAIPGAMGISFILILDNIKNLLGNILSYSRLMALGLATGIIGSIINKLAIQVSGLIPVAGIILMVLMMVGGHIINLLINLLGAFVHTARLQYVEFFPYFFEGGGQDFRPFEKKYRFVKVEK